MPRMPTQPLPNWTKSFSFFKTPGNISLRYLKISFYSLFFSILFKWKMNKDRLLILSHENDKRRKEESCGCAWIHSFKMIACEFFINYLHTLLANRIFSINCGCSFRSIEIDQTELFCFICVVVFVDNSNGWHIEQQSQ